MQIKYCPIDKTGNAFKTSSDVAQKQQFHAMEGSTPAGFVSLSIVVVSTRMRNSNQLGVLSVSCSSAG
jgi:hypothetical protein